MIPTYNDGVFRLYKVKDAGEKYPKEILVDTGFDIWFNENGTGDRLRSDLKQNDLEITTKITIPQYREINSNCVLKIDDEYHCVFNAYHFTNKNGFKETTLTLEEFHYEES